MAATQVEIARQVGLDVSSVNKILNRRPGPVFKKDTIKQVFKVARELGYDFTRLKYHHKRQQQRRPIAIPLELSIYNADGSLFDKGAAVIKDVSLSGALLTAVVLPQQSIPLRPHTIGIRMLDGALKDFDFGPERETWDAVFDDATMQRLNVALMQLGVAARSQRRREIFERVIPALTAGAIESIDRAVGDIAAARRRLAEEIAGLERDLAQLRGAA